ncbi:MAG: hypothetical protein AAGC46_15260, partial [Solirubrobacteraceae bacterium]
MERGESAASRAGSQQHGRPQERGSARPADTTLVLGGPGTGKTARVLAAAEEARARGGEPLVIAVSPSAATTLRHRAGAVGVPGARPGTA